LERFRELYRLDDRGLCPNIVPKRDVIFPSPRCHERKTQTKNSSAWEDFGSSIWNSRILEDPPRIVECFK
jgi:hypothetical protein